MVSLQVQTEDAKSYFEKLIQKEQAVEEELRMMAKAVEEEQTLTAMEEVGEPTWKAMEEDRSELVVELLEQF